MEFWWQTRKRRIADLRRRADELRAQAPLMPAGFDPEGRRFESERLERQADRIEDDRRSARDLYLEIAVIALIAVEIVFSWKTLQDARTQDEVAKSTLAIAQSQTDKLSKLEGEQADALAKLKDMNGTLQTSLDTTKQQLGILKTQQTEFESERQRKPAFEATVGGEVLTPGTPAKPLAGNFTENGATIAITLKNIGNKTAMNGVLRLRVEPNDPDPSLSVEGQVMIVKETPDPNSRAKVSMWDVPFTRLRPGTLLPVKLNIVFDATRALARIHLTVDCDEIETEQYVGSFQVVPPRP
jgi:hypothetical protein